MRFKNKKFTFMNRFIKRNSCNSYNFDCCFYRFGSVCARKKETLQQLSPVEA